MMPTVALEAGASFFEVACAASPSEDCFTSIGEAPLSFSNRTPGIFGTKSTITKSFETVARVAWLRQLA